MSSTVTTTTVTTIALVGSGSLVVILSLIAVLLKKELISTSDDPRMQSLGHSLNLAILPLGIVFAIVIAMRVFTVLR